MSSKFYHQVFLTIGVVLLTGCAHEALNKQLDTKLENLGPITNRQEIGEEAKTLIGKDANLSSEQKTALLNLEGETADRLNALWQKSAKLRMVLIKDLINADYNEGEVEIIKDKMRRLEDQRLDTIFAAVKKANVILDKQAASHPHLFDRFFYKK